MIETLCINDKNMPPDFPSNKWVKQHNLYTITHVWYHPRQKCLSVSVREINLDGMEPYNAFKIERFAILKSHIPALVELMKACGEMNNVNIEDMIKEMTEGQLETV